MSADSNTQKSPLDIVKWILAIAFLAAAVVGNYVYANEPLLYRVLGVVVLMLVSAGFALTSSQGKAFLQLLKEANIERRKVVWPTRQETVQTTLIILAVSTIVGLILWGLDGIFVRLIAFITTSI